MFPSRRSLRECFGPIIRGKIWKENFCLLSKAEVRFFFGWRKVSPWRSLNAESERTHGGAIGYLEGIFVLEKFRRRGIGGVLLSACEEWAKEQGCKEFASDTELDNAEGLSFHSGAGFYEANRIVCFVKNL